MREAKKSLAFPALTGIVRTVSATLTSSAAKPIVDVMPIPAHTNEMGVFELALDSLCCAYRGIELFTLVTYDAGACSAHNATLVRARDLHYLFGLTAGQPTLLQDPKHWLGSRAAPEADAVSEDFERGHRVVRRLFIGQVTVLLDGWEHLRTVLRIQTETFDASGTLTRTDELYLISSLHDRSRVARAETASLSLNPRPTPRADARPQST